MSRALPPPPLQLRKERLVEATVVENGGDRHCRLRRRKSVVAITFTFLVVVVVVAALGILDIGFDHRRAPVSLLLDESNLPPSLKNRLINLHVRVISSLKGTLRYAQEKARKENGFAFFSKGMREPRPLQIFILFDLLPLFPFAALGHLPRFLYVPFVDHSHSEKLDLSLIPKPQKNTNQAAPETAAATRPPKKKPLAAAGSRSLTAPKAAAAAAAAISSASPSASPLPKTWSRRRIRRTFGSSVSGRQREGFEFGSLFLFFFHLQRGEKTHLLLSLSLSPSPPLLQPSTPSPRPTPTRQRTPRRGSGGSEWRPRELAARETPPWSATTASATAATSSPSPSSAPPPTPRARSWSRGPTPTTRTSPSTG